MSVELRPQQTRSMSFELRPQQTCSMSLELRPQQTRSMSFELKPQQSRSMFMDRKKRIMFLDVLLFACTLCRFECFGSRDHKCANIAFTCVTALASPLEC